jgi:hypothetical protein
MASTTKRKAAPPDQPISRAIREAIRDDGRNLNALAVDSGIDQAAVRRFVSMERGLTLDTADRLAVALGLTVVRKGRSRKPARSGQASGPRPISDAVDRAGAEDCQLSAIEPEMPAIVPGPDAGQLAVPPAGTTPDDPTRPDFGQAAEPFENPEFKEVIGPAMQEPPDPVVDVAADPDPAMEAEPDGCQMAAPEPLPAVEVGPTEAPEAGGPERLDGT